MKKRRFLLIAGGLVLGFALGVFLLHAGLTAPDFLRPRVEGRLSRYLQASVKIKGLEFSLWSGAHLELLEIIPKTGGKKGAEGARIKLSDVFVRHKRLALLFGRYRPERLEVKHLEAEVAAGIRRWLAELDTGEGAALALPEIAVADGRIHLLHAGFQPPIIFGSLNFTLRPGARGGGSRSRLALDFKGNTLKVRMAEHAVESRWDVRFSASGFDFSALPSLTFGEKTLVPAGLEMKGDLAGRASIRMPENEAEAPGLTGEMRISGISARHPTLAAKLENGFARFDFTENTIVLLDGTVNAAGGCIEIPTAGIRLNEGSVQRAWARLTADQLALPFLADEHLLSRLPKEFRPEAVSGMAGGELTIQWTPVEGLNYGMRVALENCDGRVPAFDTRFSALDARLRFSAPGRLTISRARAQMLGGRVEAVGTCRVGANGIEEPDLELALSDVTETGPLVRQLPETVRQFIAKAGLKRPTVAGRVAFQPGTARVDLSVHADAAVLSDLPMRLDAPRVNVRWATGAGRVVFENARAKVGGSSLSATGALKLGSPMRMDVSLSGRYLSLNSRLLKWLGLELDAWEPSGTYDIELRARDWRPSGATAAAFLRNMRIQVDLRDAGLRHPDTGRILEHVYGHILVGPEGAFLSNMIGNLCGVAVRGGGRLPVGKGSQAPYFRLESENVVLDEALYERIPLDIGLKDLGLRGQCSLNAELQGDEIGGQGLSANVTAVLHHLEMIPKDESLSASGSARFQIDASDWQQPVLRGSVSLDQLRYSNLSADQCAANYVWQKGRLQAEEIIMRAYGGNIRFSDTEVHTGDWQWRTKAALAHLDLESLLGAFGIEGQYAPSGNIRGDIRMAGAGGNLGDLNGEGNIKISRGRLYSFPMLVAVFNVLDLQSPRQQPVTDAYGDFRFRQGRLQITNLLFSGGTVPAHLQGHVILDKKGGLREKPVDFLITVATKEGILDQIPLINWAKHFTIDYLRRLVFQAKVEGTLGDYSIETVSSPVTDPIRKMFSLLKKITPSPPDGN